MIVSILLTMMLAATEPSIEQEYRELQAIVYNDTNVRLMRLANRMRAKIAILQGEVDHYASVGTVYRLRDWTSDADATAERGDLSGGRL